MRRVTVRLGRVKLAVRVAGDRSKPALVLLHGWPQSSHLFTPVIDGLAADSFVLAFDLPGIGGSQGLPFSAEKHVLADLILQAAEKQKATSIIVAGLDVGGMIAFAAARDHSDRIVGAAIMNTAIPGVDPWNKLLSTPNIWHFAFHSVHGLPERLVHGHERAYFDFFFDALAGDPAALPEADREAFTEAYRRPEALRAGFDWYRAMVDDAKHNARRKIITTPIHYLRGDADGASIGEYVSGLKKIGASRVTSDVIRHSGEFSPIDASDQVVGALHGFRTRCNALQHISDRTERHPKTRPNRR